MLEFDCERSIQILEPEALTPKPSTPRRDLGKFACNKTAPPGGGYPMCIDPLMLSPDISKIRESEIRHVIEVDLKGGDAALR